MVGVMPRGERSIHYAHRVIGMACAVAVGAACERAAPDPGSSAPRAPEVAAAPPDVTAAQQTIAPHIEADLLAIAAGYTWMTRADGTSWAPADCRAPTHPAFSSKAEAGPHRRKLYTLFIKDYASYAALSGQKLEPAAHGLDLASLAKLSGMSQVIVKEAWTPVPSAAFRERCASPTMPSYLAEVTMDGKAYRACEPAGLFVMYRPPPGTEGTDEGWVYGTVQYESRSDPQGSTSSSRA
jgi:hypothetical protein